MALSPNVSGLNDSDRQVLDIWIADFRRSWREGLLAERVAVLPPPGSPLRRVALLTMIRIDLEQRWRQGRPTGVEVYLGQYPELGTVDTVPVELILAEYEARRQVAPVDVSAFLQRFPRRAEELRRRLDGGPATPRPDEPTVGAYPSTQAVSPSPRDPAMLPEQFGRYRIIKKLGQGGMGSVYLAHDSQLDRQVALKVPHFAAGAGPEVLQRFDREARTAATLEHPNICPVYDVGKIEGVPYLTMAYIQGRSLAEVLRVPEPLVPRQIALLLRKVALALHEAHARGIVHRDLKPSNIMINQRGEPVLMDFGLARRVNADESRLTQTGVPVGTPAYMAPEQLTGQGGPLGPSCDVWALGVILFEMLTGRLPFDGPLPSMVAQILVRPAPRPADVRPDVDPALDAICQKALAKRPEDRYPGMEPLARALTAYLKSGSAAAAPVEAVQVAPEPTLVDVAPAIRPSAPRRPRPPAPALDATVQTQVAEEPDERSFPWGCLVAGGVGSLLVAVGVAVGLFLWLRPGNPAKSGGGSGGELASVEHLRLGIEALDARDAERALGHLDEAVREKPEDPEVYFHRGRARLALRRYDTADADFTEAIRLRPRYAPAYAQRAAAHVHRRNYERAVSDGDEAIRIERDLAPAYAYRGWARAGLGDNDAALADCAEALRLDPRSAAALNGRGIVYMNRREHAPAVAAFTEALALDPGLAAAYNNRGAVRLEQGAFDDALGDLTEAIRLDPRLSVAYRNRAELHRRRGEFDQAIDDCREALAIEPRFAPAHATRGAVRQARGEAREAVIDLDEALRLNPQYAWARVYRGLAYRDLGDPTRAIDDYREATRLDPAFAAGFATPFAAVYRQRADARYGQSQYAPAIEDYTEAIRLDPKLAVAHRGRSDAYRATGEFDRAVADCDKAIELGLKDVYVYFSRAEAYRMKQDWDRSIADCDMAISLNAQYAWAYSTRASSERMKSLYDRAVADCDEAIKLGQDDAFVYFTRGESYRMKGDYAKAIADSDLALKRDPTYSRAYGTRGAAYASQGQHDRALADFDRAIQHDPDYAWAFYQRSLSHKAKGNEAQAKTDREKAAQLDPSYAGK
jgi:tetratricopeptide (TPR) repeat protein